MLNHQTRTNYLSVYQILRKPMRNVHHVFFVERDILSCHGIMKQDHHNNHNSAMCL